MIESETEVKRWTAKRKTQVALGIMKGKTTAAEVAEQLRKPSLSTRTQLSSEWRRNWERVSGG